MARLRTLAAVLLAALTSALAQAGAWEETLNAAEANDTQAVAGLIARGMDPNTADQTGTTLLMIAARNGNEQLLELLLRMHANTLLRNMYGDSAISLAAISGQLGAVRRLVEYGVPLSGSGWTPLQYAAYAGQREIVVYLLSKGAAVNDKAPNGQTPLMLAAAQGHSEVVRVLVDGDADLDETDPDGRTALEIAVKNDRAAAAEILRQAAADDEE